MEGQRGRSGSGIYSSLVGALATAQLRRLQFGWAVSAVGGWVFFVALSVYAFDVGGATAVGAAALTRMVPAGLAAPLAGVLADRHSRRDVLLGSIALRALTLGAIAAAVASDAPLAVVLVLAALFTIIATAHKPAQASLLPSLVETPHQLAASNAVWSAVDNGAFLAGALVSGALIATTSMSTAFLVTAGLFALATVPIALIARDPVPEFRASERIHPIEDAVDGFRQVAADRRLRMVVGVLACSTTVEGAIDVLVVLVAIDMLGLGGAGVGWLNACWGVGGVVGGAAALTLLRRGRLTAGLSAGGLLVGVPLMLIALAESVAVAVAMLVLLGIGYALIEVAGLSLLQRLPSNDLLGRAFAVVESSYWITTGLGAMLTPLLVDLIGLRSSLLAVGACLPLLVAFRWRPLALLEEGIRVPERPFKLLRGVEMFAPLPLATLENVSRRVDAVRVRAGETVVREGDAGDRFFLVADGRLDVSCERGAYPPVGAGDVFGEIALLQDVPRTATVTAREDCLLYSLDRESFLCAVFSHASAAGAARRVVTERLARIPVG
ncbi:MAG TPA: MFS transporter [Solirubrobacteraceae bacterium]|nr:MFS transporter [Solirubrobacteraceae bacterium]